MGLPRLRRGDVYKVNFPYVFDRTRRPPIVKHVMLLQEGELFENGNTLAVVEVVTTTSRPPKMQYPTDVFISNLVTKRVDSWIQCGQVYTLARSVIEEGDYLYTVPAALFPDINGALAIGVGIVSSDVVAKKETAAAKEEIN